MSRPSIPPIAPHDLRDHADQDRIDRIWERLEGDLVAGAPEARPRRTAALVLALAATFAAFGGGLVAGKRIWSAPPGATAIQSAPEHVDTDIFAAGEQDRSFDLPGVGQLRLKPGATVEMDKTGGAVTLRLVQGEASVDNRVGGGGVAIVAGEARLSTLPGSSVTVHKNDDDVDVRVDDGSAELASPAGTRHMKPGEEVRQVPIHSTVASAERGLSPKRRPSVPISPRPGDIVPDSVVPVVAGPAWLVLHNAGNSTGAYEALAQLPGGVDGAIAAAHSGGELMSISDVATVGGDREASTRALLRIVNDLPGDQWAQTAAVKLSSIFEGDPAKALAYVARAPALYRTLKPTGPFVEDALCYELRSEKHRAEATRKAQEYLTTYPHGSRCKDEAERIDRGEGTFADDGPASVGPGPSAVPSAAVPPAPVAPKPAPKP